MRKLTEAEWKIKSDLYDKSMESFETEEPDFDKAWGAGWKACEEFYKRQIEIGETQLGSPNIV